ncbi:hypothetical protein J6590_056404 [Homalodisca vitripennis]|nr:hypothetical protein J6590_056404 [Homalodisca vitripennis]
MCGLRMTKPGPALCGLKTPDEEITPAPSENASWSSETPDIETLEEQGVEVVSAKEDQAEVQLEKEKEEVLSLPKTPTIVLESGSEDETDLASRKENLSPEKLVSASSSQESQLSPPQLSPPHIFEPVKPVVQKEHARPKVNGALPQAVREIFEWQNKRESDRDSDSPHPPQIAREHSYCLPVLAHQTDINHDHGSYSSRTAGKGRKMPWEEPPIVIKKRKITPPPPCSVPVTSWQGRLSSGASGNHSYRIPKMVDGTSAHAPTNNDQQLCSLRLPLQNAVSLVSVNNIVVS